MKRFLADPLLHFFVLGAVIFAAHTFLADENTPEVQAIVVTKGRIESLVTGFTRTWQRPPTEAELRGLIDDYIREEICSREALAIGLDRDDTVIRRRLRQKFEFLAEDLANAVEPTDSELQTYLAAHSEQFRIDRQFTFKQVFLNTEQRGIAVTDDAARLIAELNVAGPNTDAASYGDTTLLQRSFEHVPADEVAAQLGAVFVEALGELPIARWQGPIESGYGIHLVLVNERTEGRLPALEEVRGEVRRQWTDARRLETKEKFYQSLLDQYTVTIERGDTTSTTLHTASTR